MPIKFVKKLQTVFDSIRPDDSIYSQLKVLTPNVTFLTIEVSYVIF